MEFEKLNKGWNSINILKDGDNVNIMLVFDTYEQCHKLFAMFGENDIDIKAKIGSNGYCFFEFHYGEYVAIKDTPYTNESYPPLKYLNDKNNIFKVWASVRQGDVLNTNGTHFVPRSVEYLENVQPSKTNYPN